MDSVNKSVKLVSCKSAKDDRSEDQQEEEDKGEGRNEKTDGNNYGGRSSWYAGSLMPVGHSKRGYGYGGQGSCVLQANGKEKAFPAFNNKKGQFVKNDLYIYVMDWNGTISCTWGKQETDSQPTSVT